MTNTFFTRRAHRRAALALLFCLAATPVLAGRYTVTGTACAAWGAMNTGLSQ